MALQWVILAYVVAAEAAVALLLTVRAPKVVKTRLVALVSLLLQPATGVVPFAVFQLLGVFFVFVNTTKRFRKWKKLRSISRINSSHNSTVDWVPAVQGFVKNGFYQLFSPVLLSLVLSLQMHVGVLKCSISTR